MFIRIHNFLTQLGKQVGRTVWNTEDSEWRPVAHLCNTWGCWLWCLLGVHTRLSNDGKCRCCRRINHSYGNERASTADYTSLSTGWWKDGPIS